MADIQVTGMSSDMHVHGHVYEYFRLPDVAEQALHKHGLGVKGAYVVYRKSDNHVHEPTLYQLSLPSLRHYCCYSLAKLSRSQKPKETDALVAHVVSASLL